jgi:hypothetical protein
VRARIDARHQRLQGALLLHHQSAERSEPFQPGLREERIDAGDAPHPFLPLFLKTGWGAWHPFLLPHKKSHTGFSAAYMAIRFLPAKRQPLSTPDAPADSEGESPRTVRQALAKRNTVKIPD